jgi:hypothetical protein
VAGEATALQLRVIEADVDRTTDEVKGSSPKPWAWDP